MTQDTSRPVGPIVENWTPPVLPGVTPLTGRFARLERLSPETHAAVLFQAFDGQDWLWDYMPNGPFHSAAQYHRWMREAVADDSLCFYAIKDLSRDLWGGVASFLRIKPEAGAIELGYITLAPILQGTPVATEAFFLMMDWAFSVGYRRFEWKCDALNAPSRRAAQRLGFSYEGLFRQATVVKGRNRDTAWFAITDQDWPALKEAFRVWLSPSNFEASGQQVERLSDLTALVRVSSDPTV